jgi:hypothetical protein
LIFFWFVWALAGVLLFLTSCSYGHRNFPGQTSGKHPKSINYVLQFDDFGSLWGDLEMAEETLQAIKKESERTNTIVVLFIHGWHHNAAPDDENLLDFAHSLESIREKLRDPLYRQSRFELTGSEDVKVIGIYVGWRGRSLPWLLDYATFWGRKATAERVGEGDLRDFLLRLNAIYRDRSTTRRESPSNTPFMGLVTFGHSFGGQVLFKVVAATLERDLILTTSFTSKPNETETKITEPLQGFGDLTVLINPALEAFQYQRIHQLSRQLAYDRRQTPLMLVLSAEFDFGRRVAFPVGRLLASVFGPATRFDQRAQWTTALGEYEPQRTHEIIKVPEAPPNKFDPRDYVKNPCKILNLDLTNITEPIAKVQLTPTANHRPFHPFIVAHVRQNLIAGHTQIFEVDLRNFLNDYVALVEGKQMLLGNDKIMRKCSTSN